MAAAITDGEVELVGARLALLGAVADALRRPAWRSRRPIAA